jgi:hypothetical protein
MMQPLHLIEGAGRVWSRLWSVRLALLAAVLGALDVGLSYYAPEHASPFYAAGAAFVSFAAAVARIVAQPGVMSPADPPAPDASPVVPVVDGVPPHV